MEIQWSLVLFTVFAGAGSWVFVGTAVSEFTGKGKDASFIAPIVAIIMMVVGGLCSVTHLSHPTRMLGAISHPTSGIAIEAFMLGFTCIAIVLYLVLLKRGSSEKARKAVAVVGAVLGILFSFLMGESYMMAARAAWNNVIVPFEYAVTSMVLGASTFLLILSLRKDDAAAAFYGLPLVVASAISLLVGIIYGAFSGVIAEVVPFWGCVVVLGVGVPATCGAMLMRKQPELASVGADAPATEAPAEKGATADTDDDAKPKKAEAAEGAQAEDPKTGTEAAEVKDDAVAAKAEGDTEAKEATGADAATNEQGSSLSRVAGLTICSTAGALVGSIVFRMLMWSSGVGLYTFFNAM